MTDYIYAISENVVRSDVLPWVSGIQMVREKWQIFFDKLFVIFCLKIIYIGNCSDLQ